MWKTTADKRKGIWWNITTVLKDTDFADDIVGREGDQRPIGEGLRKKRETWPGGRAGMWPRRRLPTENVGRTMYRPYAPTGAVSHDDDDDED